MSLISSDSILFPSAQASRKKPALAGAEVLRDITVDDLESLLEAKPKEQHLIKRIGFQHHSIARFLAQGKQNSEVAVLTGYDSQYITQLKADPAFKELVAYYITQKEHVFVDALEQMKSLGLEAVHEAKRRLEDKPESFTNTQLKELMETTLIKPITAQAAADNAKSGAQGVALALSVEFISAAPVGVEVRPESQTGAQKSRHLGDEGKPALDVDYVEVQR